MRTCPHSKSTAGFQVALYTFSPLRHHPVIISTARPHTSIRPYTCPSRGRCPGGNRMREKAYHKGEQGGRRFCEFLQILLTQSTALMRHRSKASSYSSKVRRPAVLHAVLHPDDPPCASNRPREKAYHKGEQEKRRVRGLYIYF